MDFWNELTKIRKSVDKEIAKYFDKIIRKTEKEDQFLAQALEHAKKIVLAGGKRLRPALVMCGYKAGGGKNNNAALRVAAAIELVHIFFLVHDDIIDHGNLRHGVSTVHQEFEKVAKKRFPKKDSKHFGQSFGIIVGDMIYAMAISMILESGFEAKVVKNILTKLSEVVQSTIMGQSQDVQIENMSKPSEKLVLSMCENKTARYTFEGPLHLGLLMAESKDKNLEKTFSLFSLPVGMAFQIQDDILGIFGNDKKTGKSKSSDLTEGKKTILIVKALENSNTKKQKFLHSILGNKKASEKDQGNVRKMIIDSGSLDYAKKMVEAELINGLLSIDKVNMPKESKDFLIEMVEFLKARTY